MDLGLGRMVNGVISVVVGVGAAAGGSDDGWSSLYNSCEFKLSSYCIQKCYSILMYLQVENIFFQTHMSP